MKFVMKFATMKNIISNNTSSKILLFLFALSVPVFSITNDKSTRDSYISAYMDAQSTNDAGIVYPEPNRNYGPPQHRPIYYGPPSGPHGPLIEYPSQSPFSGLMEILSQLPEKLEFLPKVAGVLLTVTKILLKVVLLKIILKFVFIFCMYFFLPKLEMLDMMTTIDMSESSTAAAINGTSSTSADDQEEMRLNKMADFVWDSVDTQAFLRKICDSGETTQKCKLLKTLQKLYHGITVPRLFNSNWSSVDDSSRKIFKSKKT